MERLYPCTLLLMQCATFIRTGASFSWPLQLHMSAVRKYDGKEKKTVNGIICKNPQHDFPFLFVHI